MCAASWLWWRGWWLESPRLLSAGHPWVFKGYVVETPVFFFSRAQHDGRLHKELPFFVLHFTWKDAMMGFPLFFLSSYAPRLVRLSFKRLTPQSTPPYTVPLNLKSGHVRLRADRWIKLPSARSGWTNSSSNDDGRPSDEEGFTVKDAVLSQIVSRINGTHVKCRTLSIVYSVGTAFWCAHSSSDWLFFFSESYKVSHQMAFTCWFELEHKLDRFFEWVVSKWLYYSFQVALATTSWQGCYSSNF